MPATALTVKTVTSLVDFTHHVEAPHWAADADEYGLTPDQVVRMKARSERFGLRQKLADEDKFHVEQHSNAVSLVVDPRHDMYVRVGMGGFYKTTGGVRWADFRKVEAGSLLSDDVQQRVRMTGQAEAGLPATA